MYFIEHNGAENGLIFMLEVHGSDLRYRSCCIYTLNIFVVLLKHKSQVPGSIHSFFLPSPTHFKVYNQLQIFNYDKLHLLLIMPRLSDLLSKQLQFSETVFSRKRQLYGEQAFVCAEIILCAFVLYIKYKEITLKYRFVFYYQRHNVFSITVVRLLAKFGPHPLIIVTLTSRLWL